MAQGQWRGDFESAISTALSLNPRVITTSSANGTAVDLQNYMAATVVISIGAVTDGTHTITLEESDASGSGFSTVAAGNLSGSFTALTSASTAGTTQEVSYLGSKRYIRVVTTVSGSPSTGGYYGALVIRARPRTEPAT